MRLRIDDRPLEIEGGTSLLLELLARDIHPTGGGCLCLAGDCSHCLVTLDGVGYVRSCQVAPRAGMRVVRHHLDGGRPPLVGEGEPEAGRRPPVSNRHLHCDVVVIGLGPSGRMAVQQARADGKEVVGVEAEHGREAIGIYSGPLVVARTPSGKLQIHPPEEIVVATGAAEILPVVAGSDLPGLVTARAAPTLAAAGIDLGRVVAVGRPPEGLEATTVEGELVRFEGDERLRAVVTRSPDGVERRHPCDTASVGLGYRPRDALLRMARGLPVRAVGGAARPSDIPSCPAAGTICPCAGVTVEDLDSVWRRGFRELELVKRATLAGTGTCQGSTCIPYLRSFLAAKGRRLEPPFTARPVTRQITLDELAAGVHHRSTPRTPLHDEHLALGARMDRTGGWWRPWTYGDADAEYRAVREAVSIGDVSPLGKLRLSGPDAPALLEMLYPSPMASLGIGRSRYALLLDERGYVLDDGLVCRDAERRYTLTLTSAGAGFGEMWIRDWIDARGLDVRLLDQTFSLGAVNVTGPRAAELLARVGVDGLPAFAGHLEGRVAGIRCRIYRLSFTGELSYELHCARVDSVTLWRRLLAAGEKLGVRPHGMKALLDLRLDKGHIVVGKDTDFDSTPRRIDHQWAVRLEKPEFVGRRAVLRTNRQPLDRQLVGLEMEPPAPLDGAVVRHAGSYAGYVTSSAFSPALGRVVMLGWVRLFDGELPRELTIDDRPARRVPTPFYDADGERARVEVDLAALAGRAGSDEQDAAQPPAGAGADSPFRPLEAVRIVSTADALEEADWPGGASAIRLAPDELLLSTDRSPSEIAATLPDRHAIVARETGFVARLLAGTEAEELLTAACAWDLPTERPAQAQGALAEIPVHLRLEEDHLLLVVRAAFAAELEERLW